MTFRDPWYLAAPFRALAFVLAVLVGGTSLTLFDPAPAEAVTVEWGNPTGGPNYEATVNGDFLVAGNGVLACSAMLVTGSGTCANLHAASNADADNVNDNFSMVNSNTVAGFTTNSSSAALTIPSGATVTKAFLNWSANTGTWQGDTTRSLCTTFSTARGVATLPSGSATGYQTRAVQLKVGGGAITSFAPGDLREDAATQATSRYYSATADVTTAFAGATTGSALTVSAGNIWAPTGAGCYAGWSLTVVYDFGTYILGNANSVPHRIIYYEGHVREGQNDAALSVDFTGFTANGAGTRVGYTLYEGDRNITGDIAEYSRQSSATYAQINNSAGAAGNIGIGRAVGSVRYTQTADTTAFTNQSVDVAAADLANVVAGDTKVTLRLGTSGDSYLLTNAVLSVPTAGLQVKKTYDGTADIQYRTSSEPATFTITITNTGAGILQNIVVADDQTNCARTLTGITLVPLASTTYTCTANAVTTAGYTSTATATASTVVGGYLASGGDSTTVALSRIALTKTSALAAGATGRAGDILTYTFTITNSGQGTLTGITLADPLSGLGAITYGAWPSGTAGTLAAGQSVTATAPYALKQTDVDAGTISNTATTSGADADGNVRPSATASRTTPITSAPALTLAKTAAIAAPGTGRVGDTVNYGFTVTNTGNVTLTNVAVTDPHTGLSTIAYGPWPSGTTGTLAPNQSVSATATYVIRQSDVDTGSVPNTASVSGRSPTGTTTTSTATASVSTVAATPAITTTKSAAYTSGSGAVGSVIRYSFSATNSGNVTLTGVAITDQLAGISALAYTWPGTAGTLAPGQTVTATATYTVKQSDVDAGAVPNRSTASGTSPSGAAVSTQSALVSTPTAAAAPALTLTKTGTAAGQNVGSVVSYAFTLTNSGNVTLTAAAITDPLAGLSAISYGTWPSGTTGTLAPGQSVSATATYTLKQSDVDAGSVVNTATSTGKPPTGANVSTTRSATVPITPTGTIAVTKSGAYTSGTGAVGSVIRWTIGFTNTGNVTLTSVALADSLAGLGTPTITWPGTAGTLAPGQTAGAVASYTVTQADVDAGAVRNTATVTARTPQNAAVSGASPEASVTTVTRAPAITVAKTGAITGGQSGNAGSVITYTFTLRNTGNVTLTGVAVTDPLAGLSAPTYTWPGTAGTLAPGATATATASYTIKQSDVDTGNVKNTATVSGTPPTGAAVTGTSGQVTTNTAAAAPAIATTKAGALATGATGVAGDTVNWTITLRNSGNVTLTAVSATDSLAGIGALTYTWPGTAGTLAPGQTATATGTSTLTQADVDAGAVSNIATGRGTPPTGAAVTSTGAATVPVAARGSISVTKTPSIASGARAGDAVTYTFLVRNTGNVTLNGVAVSDPLAGLSAVSYGTWTSGTTGRLLPGATVTATATYTVKQADVDAGRVNNTATASGTPPTGAAVTATGAATVTTVSAAPSIATTKSAAYSSGTGAVGSVVTYSFSARNSGNVTLTGVAITDPHAGLSTIAYGAWPSGTTGTLAPGQTVTATATFTVTQADVDRGTITNTATSTGTPPTGAAVTSPASAVIAPAASAPALALTKTGSAAGTIAGSTVTYSFTLRNSGNVTLTGVGITDPLSGLSAIAYGTWPSGTTGTLAPGQTVTASATYALKQSDVDAGSVANTATATGTPPTGAAVSTTASATVPISGVGSLSVTKSGAYLSGTGAVGSVIRWSVGITNSGNVTLTTVALSDTLAGLGTPTITWPGTVGRLTPGQTATAVADYTVTQADVDLGVVRNTASATGRTPQNVAVAGSSPQATVSTAASTPAITVTKAGAITGGQSGNAGSVITYTFTLRNTGNVSLTSVGVSDPLAGLGALSYSWPGTAGTLAPGQTATATASYTIKQSDVDTGNVKNTATASGTPPTGPAVTGSSGQITTSTAAPAPALVTTKTGALATGATGQVGDVVNWSFTVRNSGNLTLTGVTIADPLAGISARVYSWPGTAGTLAPGQTATATATSTLTQADVDAGSIVNTASSSGTTPTAGMVTSPTVPATVSIAARPSISITKTPSVTTGARTADVITYTFTVRNTGNVTLTGVGVSDPLAGLSAVTFGTWPGPTGRLTPGQTVTATATYTVQQADVDRGSIANTATASGTPPTGAAVTATSSATVTTVAAAPSIATTKSAAYTTGAGAVGSVVTYSFSARNSGNVTLTGVAISDPHAGLSALTYGAWPSGTTGTLAPGQTVTATATYTVTQADVDRATIANTATSTGTPPTGAAVSSSASATIAPVAAAPALALTKSGSAAGTVVGSTVTYSFTLRNSGNVTVTGAGISDPLSGLSAIAYGTWPSGTTGTLAPGQTVTASATYALKQSDVDAGSVANTATATATPATGATVSTTASATVPIATSATATLTKTAAYTTGSGAVGSVITYTFTARNSGNVTLTGVAVSDPLAGLSALSYGVWPSGTVGTLAPAQSVVATATYTVTQADVNRGRVDNRATVSARAPAGGAVSAQSAPVSTSTVAAAPAIATAKSAAVSGSGVVGDRVTYTLQASNTGNVTLTGVVLSDPMFTPGQLDYAAWPSGVAGTLQPGQTITATGFHTITQADADAGSITNTASSTGTPPTGAAVSSSSPTLVTPLAARAPSIALTQTGALPSGSTGRAGDVVTWTFTIRNTGTTTLSGVQVTGQLAGISSATYGTWPGVTGTLAPGQSVTATATSTLTQAQVDARSVTDPATATGLSTTGATVSASQPATVSFAPASTITLQKSAVVSGAGLVGDVITYTYVARNTGATTLTGVSVADPHTGLSTITYGTWPSGTTGTLLPTQSVTATATYTIVLADVNAGRVTDTATVSSTNPQGTAVSGSSDQVVVPTGAASAGLSLVKTASISGAARGQTITYTFVARNTGNVTLTGVTVSDPLGGLSAIAYTAWPNAPGVLNPGQSVTATATYVVQQADVDRGYIDNRATVTGAPPVGAAVSTPSALVRTPTVAAAPAIGFTKTGSVTSGTGAAGSTVRFAFTIVNTGNVTLTSVAIADQLADLGAITFTNWQSGTPGTLAPGQSATAVADYTVKQADVDAGSVVNTATASGTPPTGAPTSTPASATVPTQATDLLTVTKTAAVGGGGAVGGTVTYTFVARNAGTTTLTAVTIADPLPDLSSIAYGSWPGPAGRLLPGQTVTATATYAIDQDDVDLGSVTNRASATATAAGSRPVSAQSAQVVTPLAAQSPNLTFTKTVDVPSGARAGDQLRYTIRATNSGNVTLNSVGVTDRLTGISALAVAWPGTAGILAPGQTVVVTASYVVKQSDVDAGGVTNIADATATPPSGPVLTRSASAVTSTVAAAPAITVTDSGALAPASTGVRGDRVNWSYVVTNTGNVTLSGVALTEALGGATVPAFGTWPGTPGILAPGQSVTATSSYLLTQADVDRGSVRSDISTRGTSPTGTQVTSAANATVTIAARPDYTVTKTSELLNGGIGQVGDTVRYRLTVTNTGNVTLYRAFLTDPLPGLGPQNPTWPNPADPRTIGAGETATGYADYVITQADVNLGSITNTAHVGMFTTRAPVAGETRIDRDSNTVITPTVQAAPRLTIAKTGVASGSAGVGSTITWTVTVTNAGNVTLSSIAIVDSLALSSVSTSWTGGVTGTLQPGGTATLTGTSTIAQSDVDAGSVTNTATVSGRSARDASLVTAGPAAATVRTANPSASIDVTKSASQGPGFTGKAGDTVIFDYTLTNTGNVTLTAAQLQESLSNSGVVYGTWPSGTAGTLRPGDSVTGRTTHVVTQAEVDAGLVASPVTGVGTTPTGGQVTDVAAAGVPITARPTMVVTKVGTTQGGGGVGARIDYAFTIRNTGNVTLSLVDLLDDLAGVSDPVIAWPNATRPGVLLPGETADATATYTVTQADLDTGGVTNTATATGKPPIGDTILVDSPRTFTSVAPAAPSIDVTKTGTPTAGLRVGDLIDYMIRATNDGNVTLHGVAAVDRLAGVSALTPTWPGAEGVLAPAQVVEFRAQYRITQADVDRGSVANTVDVSGLSPTNVRVTDTATQTSTTIAAAPTIAVTDDGALAPGATGRAGDRVNWSYVVTNTGNVTLTTVQLTDALGGASTPVFGSWPGTTGVLAPGQSVTASGFSTLTQAQVDAGSIRSVATARGTGPSPSNTVVTATDDAVVPIVSRPDYTVSKSSELLNGGIGQVGDTVRYRLTVTNTGNVTLYRAFLTDPLPGLGPQNPTWPDPADPRTIGAGQTATGYADYVITQADVDLGSITNTAHVGMFTTRAPVAGETRIDRDSNTVVTPTVQAAPRLTIAKTGVASGSAGVGSTITWTVTVTNAGNVTLSSIAIVDSLALSGVTTTWTGGVSGTLPPGGTATLTGTSTIAQSDVDAGSVTNTATTSGRSARDGAPVAAGPAAATVRTIGATAAIDVTKSAALVAGATGAAGDLVRFGYAVANTGNVTLTAVALADALGLPGPIAYDWNGNPDGTLPVGGSATATGFYRLTQADVDRGSVSSLVTAAGTSPTSQTVTDTATAGVVIAARPSLSVVKNGAVRAGQSGGVGDRIDYTFTVRNTGNVTLTLVDLIERLGGVSDPVLVWPDTTRPGVLLPAEQATATASYVVTQADVDRGTVSNLATGTGKPPVGDTISQDSNTQATTVAAAAPAVDVVKTATPTSGVRAGDSVAYRIEVRNTGNVGLTGVAIADTKPGLGPLSISWPGATGELAPGQFAVATADYRATQADVDAGTIANTASATATGVRGGAVGDSGSVSSTTVARAPAITVTDDGALAPGATGRVGDRVNWSYVVTNTGNVTLTGVQLTEALAGASVPAFGTWPGTPNVLAPGQSVTASGYSTLTQAQVDAGSLRSVATARGTGPAPANTVVTATDDATVTIAARPSFTNLKGASYLGGGTGQAGDTIRYTLTVANTGNVTLYRGQLIDPLPGLGTQFPNWPIPGQPGTLPVGTTATGYADYLVTQADVDRGYLDNTATVVFRTTPTAQPGETPITVPSNTVHTEFVEAAPQLTQVKSSVLADGGRVGDTISYTIVTRNTGNVTVTGITISDPLPRLSSLTTTWPAPAGRLEPGQSATTRATFVVQQADVDRGSVTNRSTASGVSARDGVAVATSSNELITTLAAAQPGIAVTDSGALASPADNRAGGTVAWTYRVTNTGNVTLTGVGVADSLPGVGAPTYTWPGAPDLLAPGQSVDIRATSTLTQADVDAGSIISRVATRGTPPIGADATANATATVVLGAAAALSVTKTAALQAAGRNGVGDTVVFSFVVLNSGNVTLTGVALTDSLAGLTVPVITWPTPTDGELPPGTQATARATYQLSQQDVDRGSVSNQATATGLPPTGPALIGQSTVATQTTAARVPALTLTKGGALASGTGDAGSVVRFTFSLRNTGNVTVSGLTVADALAGVGTPTMTFPDGTPVLAPGATASGFADYTLTQADVDRGYVDNTATAAGTGAGGTPVGTTSNTLRFDTAASRPAVTATQSGGFAPGQTGVLGDTVRYTFTVTNTGNTTLTGVGYTTTVGGLTAVAPVWPGTAGTLTPGQSLVITADHVVTQADVDAGVIRNDLTGSGRAPLGIVVSDPAPELVLPLATASPDLDLSKTGVARAGGGVGDVIDYSFELRNNGSQTPTAATIDDGLPGVSTVVYGTWPTGTVGTLPPGAAVTGTATYTVTQADVDRGSVINTANGGGTAPGGSRVTTVSPVSTVATATPGPAIEITKTAALAPGATGVAGDQVRYRFDVENTGNVTLDGVTIDDDQPGITGYVYTWPGVPGVLAPGQHVIVTAVYTLEQADVDAGSITSTATTGGTGALGGAVADTDPATVALTPPAGISIDKTATPRTTPVTVGTVIDYGFTVRNTGAVTLQGVAIADPLLPAGAIAITWPGANGVLAPGEQATATGSYTVTTADVAAGAVANTATASGTTPGASVVTATDAVVVQVPNGAALSLSMSVALSPGDAGFPGDTLLYTYVITNTGTVTLTDVTLVDPKPGLGTVVYAWPDPANPGVLLPGQSATASAPYVIQPGDEGDLVTGTASVTATGASPLQTVQALAEADIQLPTRPVAPIIPGLASTGTDTLFSGSIAALLIGLGLVLALAGARRRRRGQEEQG